MGVMLSVGGNVYSTTDRPAEELFFGSVDGVALLRRDGERWQVEQRALQGLHVSSLLLEPRSGVIFTGTHNGGLHASLDHGKTWERLTGGIEPDEVYSLAVAEAHGQVRVYAGTQPARLYVSTDLGQTWTDLPALRDVPGTDAWTFPPPPHVAHVKHIALEPNNCDTIYACVEQGALLKSTDAGRSWRVIFDAAATDAHRMSIPPTRPEWLYLTRGDYTTGYEGIYLSVDRGAHWERLIDRSLGIGYPDATLIHPDRPDLIFVAGAIASPNNWSKLGKADTHVARTRDGGRSWDILPGMPPGGAPGNVEAMAMNLWPGGFGIFGGSTDGEIYYSKDEGESWTTIARGLPAISKSSHWRWLQHRAA